MSFCFLSAMPVLGQTVRPLIDENVVKGPGKSASGRIEYYNDSLQPLTVTLEPKASRSPTPATCRTGRLRMRST